MLYDVDLATLVISLFSAMSGSFSFCILAFSPANDIWLSIAIFSSTKITDVNTCCRSMGLLRYMYLEDKPTAINFEVGWIKGSYFYSLRSITVLIGALYYI